MSNLQPRLQTLAQIIPPLSPSLHKGDCGRIAAIGGCEEYTGAPYFAASSALRLGVDIAYVICEKDAATVIKSYSPDLIVTPYLRSVENLEENRTVGDILSKIGGILDKLHAVSVGSGLGNDKRIRECVVGAVKAARDRGLPIVLDADSLALVCEDPGIIQGYKEAVLTPNAPEFNRLAKALHVDPSNMDAIEAAQKVAEALGGVTIVRKGPSDVITDGQKTFVCEETGGLRRCGGQGDILSGSIAAFLAWGSKYRGGGWKHTGDEIRPEEITLLAAYAACLVTRHASFLAYDECGRATQSSNVLEQVDIAFDNKFDELLKAVKPK
ncbi:hypothetical protein GGI15_001736 [Coemansia interrupta]|uniref:ATP-dependent (S)-NAD(P)H-hydrate dehydratase n=1 Tax=Coemansia interrupta TaxID=1126814 RepID=A0A9W8LL00_9FUNG|nr:hypothetical protein GGI15_001736 [Coemansia interrupta]